MTGWSLRVYNHLLFIEMLLVGSTEGAIRAYCELVGVRWWSNCVGLVVLVTEI